MHPLRDKAIELREKGYSYNEIKAELGIGKSTLSYMFRNIQLDAQAVDILKSKRSSGYKAGLKKWLDSSESATLKEVRSRGGKTSWDRNKTSTLARFAAYPRPKKNRLKSGDGRWMLQAPEGYNGRTYIDGRYVYEHRYLIEQEVGRALLPNEVVHHVDEDKLNNMLENLELTTRSQHASYHGKMRSKL